MTRLTHEQGVIATVLADAGRPLAAADVAAGTAWPGARTFGLARTRRVLRELAALGVAQRARGRWALTMSGGHESETAKAPVAAGAFVKCSQVVRGGDTEE